MQSYLQSLGFAANLTSPPPVKGVYVDWRDVDWNTPENTVKAAVDAGYNVVYLAFYLLTSSTDMLQAWAGISNARRAAALNYAHSRGAVVMLSASGATTTPYTATTGRAYGQAVATYAVQYGLDGVDFDLENLEYKCTYGSMTSANIVTWMSDATLAARSVLGPNRLLTHAPEAPYFGGAVGNSFTGSVQTLCYTGVYLGTAGAINWFNVQFYNQGSTCFLTYTTLFVASSNNGQCVGGTAVSELVTVGVPLDRIVIGKPVAASAAGSGYIAPADLGTILTTAAKSGNTPAGVFTWDYQAALAEVWITSVAPY